MKRYLDTTMKLVLNEGASFEGLMQLLRTTNAEVEFDGDFIVYIQHPPKELFKHIDSFEWIKGVSYIWYKDELITPLNYKRIVMKITKGEDILWDDLLLIPPESIEENFNFVNEKVYKPPTKINS